MKTLRLHKAFDLRFHDEPAPDVGPDEVLIKVGSVGVCASDVHYYREGRIGDQVVEKPLILGHEFSGTVVKMGANVSGLSEGSRVAVEPGKHCGECDMCLRGLVNLCARIEFFGTPPVDGCLREYLDWPASLCIPVAHKISMDEAAMVEPLAVGVYAVDLARMKGGERVAVLGAGAIGLSTLQAAKAAGASMVIATDPIPERCEKARKLGADLVFNPSDELTSRMMDATNGGADVVFECAGMPDAVWQTVQVVRPAGRIVVVGIPEVDEYRFLASLCRRREVNVQFVRRSRDAARTSVEMMESGEVTVSEYAAHVFSFENSEDALKLAARKTDGVIRAVIRVSNE